MLGSSNSCNSSALHAESATILSRHSDDNYFFLHVRVITDVFGFPDDVYLQLSCVGGETIVEMQSKSRVGRGDLGTNLKRLVRYSRAIHLESAKLPNQPCQ